MKSAICATLLLFLNYSASALKCYNCNIDTHGAACYDPLGTNVKALDCKITTTLKLTTNDTQMQMAHINISHDIQPRSVKSQEYSEWDSYSNNYQCVQFEIRNNYFGTKDYIRKCTTRSSQQQNYCSSLERNGRINGYSVTKCDVCFSDYCNSSKNIKLSLFLNAIFFFVFYYITDFGKQ